MIKKINRKLPAFITAICIVFASISVATSVLADDFVPQNLLRTDLAGTPTCVIKSISTGAVSSHNQFNGAGTVAIIADGDTSTRVDAYGANDWGNNSGIVFELNNAAYCGDAVIYSGYEAYPDTYDVYASDSVDTLYTTASLVGTGVVCTGSQVLIPVNREVKYLAVFLTDYTYNGRIAEIELWSAEEGAGGETQEYSNLLETHNDYAGGILYNRQNGSVSANGKFDQNGAIAVATDKDRETHCDVWGWDANTGVGVLYTLDDVYSIDKIVIYSGFEALPDLYRVYAAADLDTLYTDASLVGANMNCPGLLELDVSTDAKYIAFIFDGDGGRVKEYEVYGSKKSDETFVSENLLTTDLAGVKAIIKNIENGSVSEHNQFNGAGTLAIIADGDRETRVDAYGANDWGNHSGVLFTLNNAAYCGKVSIFAGYEAYPDKYDVYVAEELADLYSDSSRIAAGIVCTGEEAAVEVNREVKYLAVFLTDYTYNGRIAEIELWSAEKSDTSDPEPGGDPQPGGDPEPGGDPQPGGDPEPGGDPQPTADNFIRRHLAADGAYGILQDVASKSVSDGDRFTAAEKDAVKLAIDGDSEKQFEVWGALDWEYPKNVGVRYSLDAMYKVDFAKITAGTSENPVTFDVYASDSIGTLFANDSKVASAVECGGSEVKVNISKQISCVAFVVTNYNGSAMISEFDLSGDDKAIEKETVTWPEAPNTGNILKNATAKEIIAPNGDYSGSKEYDYRFMDEQTETSLSKLTDGNLEKHYDIWSLTPKDKPGVLYELDKYYDLTHLHAWAGAYGSELITNYGYKVYASDNAETLFKTKNLVFTYSNSDDTTNEFGIN
ncbi:MAG: hypothetical protein IK086_02035, partial [Clostridia bacterium]|nr:hypothetical protein [Clostridia bacterium]